MEQMMNERDDEFEGLIGAGDDDSPDRWASIGAEAATLLARAAARRGGSDLDHAARLPVYPALAWAAE